MAMSVDFGMGEDMAKLIGAIFGSVGTIFAGIMFIKFARQFKKAEAFYLTQGMEYEAMKAKYHKLIDEYRNKLDEEDRLLNQLKSMEAELYRMGATSRYVDHKEKQAKRQRRIDKLKNLSKRTNNPHEAQLAESLVKELQKGRR